MERYDNVFAELKSRQEGAFVPFVTLGDPPGTVAEDYRHPD